MKKTILCCLASLLFIATTSSLYAQNGLSFDGTNDFVQTNYPGITGNSDRSVEAWIKPSYISTQQVITDWGSMPNGTRFTFNLIAGKVRCELGGQGVTGSEVVTDGNWHHVAVTYSNTASPKFRIYVDGILDTAFNLSAVTMNTSSTTKFRMGVRVDNNNNFIGLMDEVRIWDHQRSQAQLDSFMFQEFCEPQNGLVAYHKMNHGSAGNNNSGLTTSIDMSGNGYNGTLSGFALSGSTSNWITGYALAQGFVSASISETGCGSYTSPSGNYTWTSPGTYYDTIPSFMGCDSVLTITLAMSNNTTASFNAQACSEYISPSGNYTWTQSGTYMDTIGNALGCDSIITVHLTINSTSAEFNATGCESYTSPSGNYTWMFNGTYLDTITNSVGCDSALTIHLEILQNTSSTISETACFSYTSPSGNQIWNSSGNYQDIIANAAGCDSVITINLTIDTVNTKISISNKTLVALASGATYQWVDCNDNFKAISNANTKVYTPTKTGKYACIIVENGCTDTTACVDVTIVGIGEHNKDQCIVWPNPSTGIVTISGLSSFLDSEIKLMNLAGEILNATNHTGSSLELFLPEQKGIYLISIQDELGTTVKMIVKQ